MAFWSITQEQVCQCSKILMPFLSLSDSIIVIIILFLCFRILSIDYFQKAYKTCSILSWGAVPLKVVWKPVRKVPDLRHSMSMTKMSVIYTAWTFQEPVFFFFSNLSSCTFRRLAQSYKHCTSSTMYFSTLSQFITQSRPNIINGGEGNSTDCVFISLLSKQRRKTQQNIIFFKQNLCFLYFTYFTLFYHGKLWWR